MSFINATCPHCHTENVSFKSVCEYRNTNEPDIYTVFFVCGHCERGLVADIIAYTSPTPHQYGAGLENYGNHKIISIYPMPISPEAPQYIPDNIKNFFLQALLSLRHGNFDSSAMTSRKVLEIATKFINPDFKGKLFDRIEELEKNGRITSSIKNWAHSIRLDGNEAAHDEKPTTQESAKELLDFVEMFLIYCFTLPGMLKARKINKKA